MAVDLSLLSVYTNDHLAGATGGERLARLKPNGRVSRRSPDRGVG